MNAKPVATKTEGMLCFSPFNVCETVVGISTAPVPYPNLGDLVNAEGVSETVFVQEKSIVLVSSEIPSSSGGEAGFKGTFSGTKVGGNITFETGSKSVFANGKQVVRMMDTTNQNNDNARGKVISGDPTVFVGD